MQHAYNGKILGTAYILLTYDRFISWNIVPSLKMVCWKYFIKGKQACQAYFRIVETRMFGAECVERTVVENKFGKIMRMGGYRSH